MSRFDRRRLAPVLLAALAPGLVHADELALAGDARLSGVVRSISPEGVVELASPLSPEPVRLKKGAVRKVDFEVAERSAAAPTSLLELTNGDQVPAHIQALGDDALTVDVPDAGTLRVPRTALRSMQLGVHQRRVIYSGPRGDDRWTQAVGNQKAWTFRNGALVANGPASSSQDFDAPRQFVLSFKLKWDNNPNFKVYFADPLDSNGSAADRYYLIFNMAGMEIKRESATGRRYQTVLLIPRSPEEFPANEVTVEIRVDRQTSRLHVLLDGEPEAAGKDPGGEPPTGNGVTFVNASPIGSSQEISRIRLLDFDNAAIRHRTERRGDPQVDSLISRDEDRWGGRLTGIRRGDDGLVLSFKSDFQEEPLELPEAEVSTLFFGHAEEAEPPAPENPVTLRLRGQGTLTVTSCEFTEAGLTAEHPLLGKLEIARAGIAAIELGKPEPEGEP